MVALAIAAPALLLLFRQGGVVAGVTRSAALHDQAITRARSRLDALVGAALAPGDRDGDDGGGFRWHTRIGPISTLPAARPAEMRGAYAAGTTLYAVTVTLSWADGNGTGSVELATRRLGPTVREAP